MCNRYTNFICPKGDPSSSAPLSLGPSWPFSAQIMITSSVPVAQARNLGIILALALSLTLSLPGFRMHMELAISYHLFLQSGLSLCHFLPGFTGRASEWPFCCIFVPLQSVLKKAARLIL